ncbi:hypothetical protein Tco_1427115 [Tanacetum coccineum]
MLKKIMISVSGYGSGQRPRGQFSGHCLDSIRPLHTLDVLTLVQSSTFVVLTGSADRSWVQGQRTFTDWSATFEVSIGFLPGSVIG